MWKVVFLLAASVFPLAAQAAPGSLLRDEPLRQHAAGDARVLAALARGDALDILAREGGWLRVASARGEGWVRLLSVRRDVAAQTAPLAELRGELAPASRRLETRIVAVAGFRGIEEEDKIEAAALAALERLARFRATPAAASAAASDMGLAPGPELTACGSPCPPEPGAAAGTRLSLMSAWLLQRLSPEDEAKIGRALAVRLLIAMPAVDDAALQRYVNRVGRWVVAAQGPSWPQADWLFAVLDSEAIQAYSTPGGHVFITRGLYRLLRDEAELAAVLAREVARLGDKRLLDDLRRNAPGGGRPRDEAAFLRQLLGNGLEALQRPHAVEGEFRADRDAVLLAARAGYDPYALAAFLQDLGGLPAADPRLAPLARVPPGADSRLARLSASLEECLAGLPAGKAPPLYRMND